MSTLAIAAPSLVGDASLLTIIKDSLTILTLLGAGFLGYLKFYRGKPLAGRANLRQSVQSVRLDEELTVVQIEIVAENTGDVVLNAVGGKTLLQQLRPLSHDLAFRLHAGEDPVGETKTEINFPTIRERNYVFEGEDAIRIDPKETTEDYCEFV